LVSKIVIVLKNSFTNVCTVVGKSKSAFVACLHRSEIFLSIEWKFTQNAVRDSAPAVFAAQPAVQHCNPLHNQPEGLAPQNEFNVVM